MDKLKDFKMKMKLKEPVIGTYVSFCDSSISELLGYAGYDFIWIDTEHTAIDKYALLLHLIAAGGSGTPAFVRVAWNDAVLVKPILEMGPEGIIFPFIKTAEDAENAVRSCNYPPEGIRGFGPIRAAKYGMCDTLRYIKESSSSIWKIIQIECVEAVDNLERILDVEGIDAIMVGPNDLAGSIGLPGQTGHDQVKRLMDRIGDATAKSDIPLGVAMGYDPEVTKEWIERGARWFALGGDFGFLSSAARKTLADAKELHHHMSKGGRE